jgi:uncharacterized protein YjdB
LNPAGTYTLAVTYIPSNTTQTGVSWTSSNESVATVSSTGQVTAVSEGTAAITATSTVDTSKKATCDVTVNPSNPPSVSGVTLNKSQIWIALSPPQTQQLTATVSPSTADQRVRWSSSDTTVAEVSSSGLVTPKNAGTAIITAASAADSTKKAECTVHVSANAVTLTDITLSETTLALTRGASHTLAVTYIPQNTTDSREITWTSSNESVATVSNGVVTTKSAGSAVITATSVVNGNIAKTCTVTVEAPPLSSISLNKTSLILNPGNMETLTVIYTPADTTQTGVTWESSNPAVAMVLNGANGMVMAVSEGTATITAISTVDSSKRAACTVTVSNTLVPVTGISLNQSTLNLGIGGRNTLIVIYTPSNTTQTGVTWTSSNESVATVSNGEVTGISNGTATITATSTANSSKKATCTVTVSNTIVPVTRISLNQGYVNLGPGNTFNLTVTYFPSNTTQMGVTWTSNNPAVATVDSNGQVTAVSGGYAQITARSTANIDLTAVCTISVEIPLTGISLSDSVLPLYKGNTHCLTVTYTPADTNQTGVNWESSDLTVATVDYYGFITAVGEGTATITARSYNSNITATCTVTVTAPPLTGIKLNVPSLTLGVGISSPLTVIYTPADVDPAQTGVNWESSDLTVATVDYYGLITAVGEGSATITATSTADPGKTAACVVTVNSSGSTGINVNLSDFPDEEITLGTFISNRYLIFTAPAGYNNYFWYVDNSGWLPSTNMLQLGGINPGKHTVMVVVETTNGSHFSKTVHFTVGY